MTDYEWFYDNPPSDYLNPKWDEYEKFYNWRNYIPKPLQEEWPNFTSYQRELISRMANEAASEEDWNFN